MSYPLWSDCNRDDPAAPVSEAGYVRIIDESDEDYLDPGDYFVSVDVPQRRGVC